MRFLTPATAPVQPSQFQPAERADPRALLRQSQQISGLGGPRIAVELLPFGVLVLNQQRQIVFANQAVAQMLARGHAQELIGQRVGEVCRCVHASETAGGCGTTDACTTCGAALAIQAAQGGKASRQECRIASTEPGGDLDLRVWARPFAMSGEDLTFFTLIDISSEKRREALERIFFHDVLNTAGGLKGIVSLNADASSEERDEFSGDLVQLTTRLVDEIVTQRDLLAMEKGALRVAPEPTTSAAVLESVAAAYREHEVAEGRTLHVADDAQHVALVCDQALLGRVLGNMVKNALEASPVGGTVTVGCRVGTAGVCFSVHNPSVMPRTVQLQIFERSFSTKGTGRGLGTYSMKLLSERYLGGRVWFSSTKGEGTTFYAEYPLEAPQTVEADQPSAQVD
jgi:K+-sensing histidine kinase KdpD